MKENEDKMFRNEAKLIVDMLFENRLFRDNLTRNDMNALEDYLTFVLGSRFDTHIRMNAIMAKIEKTKQPEQTERYEHQALPLDGPD